MDGVVVLICLGNGFCLYVLYGYVLRIVLGIKGILFSFSVDNYFVYLCFLH